MGVRVLFKSINRLSLSNGLIGYSTVEEPLRKNPCPLPFFFLNEWGIANMPRLEDLRGLVVL